jgi:hypothetical protein
LSDGAIVLCDIETGVLSRSQRRPSTVLALAVSADGLTLVSSYADESILIHRLRP